jgi:hypothetical protein
VVVNGWWSTAPQRGRPRDLHTTYPPELAHRRRRRLPVVTGIHEMVSGHCAAGGDSATEMRSATDE